MAGTVWTGTLWAHARPCVLGAEGRSECALDRWTPWEPTDEPLVELSHGDRELLARTRTGDVLRWKVPFERPQDFRPEGRLPLPDPALRLASGQAPCVLLEGGEVDCWRYEFGSLIVFDTPPRRLRIGAPAVAIASSAGTPACCTLEENGRVLLFDLYGGADSGPVRSVEVFQNAAAVVAVAVRSHAPDRGTRVCALVGKDRTLACRIIGRPWPIGFFEFLERPEERRAIGEWQLEEYINPPAIRSEAHGVGALVSLGTSICVGLAGWLYCEPDAPVEPDDPFLAATGPLPAPVGGPLPLNPIGPLPPGTELFSAGDALCVARDGERRCSGGSTTLAALLERVGAP